MHDIAAKLQWHITNRIRFPGASRLLRELRRERDLTEHEWQELRNRRLRDLLVFAGNHVPYYRRLFEQCGFDPHCSNIAPEIARIPVLTKALVRKHFDDLIADTARPSAMIKNASGGSTGVPLTFLQDWQYKTLKRALSVYYREWWHIHPYERTAVLWGGTPQSPRANMRYLDVFRMDDNTMRGFLAMLATWRPAYMFGYASALSTLAHFVKDAAISPSRFRAIRSGADMLWPHERHLIESVFESPVYNHYGSREINNIAAECPEGRQLHLISTWRHVEIADDDDEPIPAGMPGNVIVTDLSNYTMPFIRYRNEDVAAFSEEPCSCGRPSPVLAQLLGRRTDVIRASSGEVIHGHYFAKLLQVRGRWFRQFQVHQPTIDRLVVRYVPAAPGHESAMREALGLMAARLGPDVAIESQVCEYIAPLHNGKRCYVLSEVQACGS